MQSQHGTECTITYTDNTTQSHTTHSRTLQNNTTQDASPEQQLTTEDTYSIIVCNLRDVMSRLFILVSTSISSRLPLTTVWGPSPMEIITWV